MKNSSRHNRFQLIKKFVGFKQIDIQKEISELNYKIKKKETTIHSFENYLFQYKQDTDTETLMGKPSFLNRQFFIDQLAKVLFQEKNEIKMIESKIQKLSEEYLKNSHQIETIDAKLLHMTQEENKLK